MRPVLLDILNFRGWKQRTEIPLEATITAIVAENRRGKSSTTNALEWCLFGSEITKKGSGIDERQDWEIYPRGGDDQPTVVRLVLDGKDGRYELVRCRSPKSGLREPDEFSVTCPDGNVLSGKSAEQWKTDQQLPDWQTYRRAHCFHQEAARTRVLDVADRSGILADLLGLEAEIELQEKLKAYKPTDIIKSIDEMLVGLTADVERSLSRPLREVHKIETLLEDKGIQRIAINEDLAVGIRKGLLERASTLAKRLEIEEEFPEVSDSSAVLSWVASWPTTTRREAQALKDLEQKRVMRAKLANAISAAAVQDGDWTQKQSDVETAIREGGDYEAREAALCKARTRLATADHALRQANSRLVLFQDVKLVLDDSGDTKNCPVCSSSASGLLERVDKEINALQTAELEHLVAEIEGAKSDEAAAQSVLNELQGLVEAEGKARSNRDEARSVLRDLLDTEVHDAVAEAKKLQEALDLEIKAMDNLANDRDESLKQHEHDAGLLTDIERLFDARRRASTQIDLGTMNSWQDLNIAIDSAAGFACDLDALAQMARTIQEERSTERVGQVNATLGKYYELITGEAAVSGIRVQTKRTARKLAYELVDQAGNQTIPVLNQAAINALSLALLFAQAESQADADGLCYIVLDDPIQSLDANHQIGLAKAIEALPPHWGVMLGAIESPLVERLREYVSVPRHMIMLGQYNPETGSQIESQESL